MTALDFPDTPAVGQTYGSLGTVWRWNGARWESTSGASGARGRVAYAQVTVPQTGISAMTDIAGLSVTWTADPSRTYRISMFAQVYNMGVVNGIAVVYIRDGAGNAKQGTGIHLPMADAGAAVPLSVVESGLSGSQTRKVSYQTATAAQIAMSCSPGGPAYIMVEDITHEAGSSGTGGVGTWNAYTPVVTASVTNPNLGTGGRTYGYWMEKDGLCHWTAYIADGGTGMTAGNGVYFISLPPKAQSSAGGSQITGHGWMYGQTGFKLVTVDNSPGRLIMASGQYLTHAEGFGTGGAVLDINGWYRTLP